MSPIGKFTLRLGIYGSVLGYLAGDLFWFHGPLSRRLRLADPASSESAERATRENTVAVVYGHPLTRSQLDRAVAERLWLEGRSEKDLTPENRKLVRYAAIDDLIDHELLRMKVKANGAAFKPDPAEVDARYQRFATRFASPEELSAALRAEGMGDTESLRERLAARIQQERYVESRIAPLVKVDDAEARKWFDAHRDELAIPERIEARHIFVATLDRPDAGAKAIVESALASLNSGSKDFATLARESSEDEANKNTGGNLGWMSRTRLPEDFADAVFALPGKSPALVRTKLGWHLVEVTGRKPAEPRTYESARPEIIAALESAKRASAIPAFRNALRNMESRAITLYHDVITREPGQ